MKLTRRQKIWLCVIGIVVLVGFILFACRDILMYYMAGVNYVKANYTATTVEIPCDIEFTVDLTIRAGQEECNLRHEIEYPDDPGLYYKQFGRSTYILDDRVGMHHSFSPEKGYGYNLQFWWEINTNNPLKHTVIMPFNTYLYESELVTTKTTLDFGGGPDYNIPVENITVVAGGQEYTPVWYETMHTTGMYGDTDGTNYYTQFYQLGLFNDPTVLDKLLADGVTTATVKIDTLYKTEYRAPGMDKLFASRKKVVMGNLAAMKDDPNVPKLPFECGIDGLYGDGNIPEGAWESEVKYDFLIGEEWSVIPGRRVIECNRNGAIVNYSGPSEMTIVKAEPIVEDNIGGEWQLFMTPIYPDATGHMITGITPEIMEAELNFKLPFTWKRSESYYMQYRIGLLQQDVASYGVPEDEIRIKVHGVRWYLDDGTIYEFYDNDFYIVIPPEE